LLLLTRHCVSWLDVPLLQLRGDLLSAGAREWDAAVHICAAVPGLECQQAVLLTPPQPRLPAALMICCWLLLFLLLHGCH
jgi:hypothetical protein